jgi:hypothetical protein
MINRENYRENLNVIADALAALYARADALAAEMEQLGAAGISDATPYWRKNRDGEKTILTLTHSLSSERVQSGGSRSEYIGDKNASPEKVQAALDSLERYKKYLNLKNQLERIESTITINESSIDGLLWRLSAEQNHLPGI